MNDLIKSMQFLNQTEFELHLILLHAVKVEKQYAGHSTMLKIAEQTYFSYAEGFHHAKGWEMSDKIFKLFSTYS